MSISIWVDDENKEEVKEKIEKTDEGSPSFDALNMQEFCIDKETGDIEGFIEVEELGVGIDIPFRDWFSQFLKFNSFSDLSEFLSNHEEEVQKAKNKIEEIRKKSKEQQTE